MNDCAKHQKPIIKEYLEYKPKVTFAYKKNIPFADYPIPYIQVSINNNGIINEYYCALSYTDLPIISYYHDNRPINNIIDDIINKIKKSINFGIRAGFYGADYGLENNHFWIKLTCIKSYHPTEKIYSRIKIELTPYLKQQLLNILIQARDDNTISPY